MDKYKNMEDSPFVSDNPNVPAFPMANELGNLFSSGLTKREYFASMAMQGLCAKGVPPDWKDAEVKKSWVEWVSSMSIEIADELLKQLVQTVR